MVDNHVDKDAWRRLQHGAFLGWVNARIKTASDTGDDELRPFSLSPFKKLQDLSASGGGLWALCAAVCEQRPRRPRGVGAGSGGNNASNPFAARGVVEFCLQHLQTVEQVKLVNIGASDLIEGDEKLLLGFVWTLIRRYQIVKGGNNEMLEWVNSHIKSQKLGTVANFKSAWQDGRAFAALTNATLVQALGADRAAAFLLKFADSSLDRAGAVALMEKTFQVAQDQLHVPILLDAALVYDAADDLAVQTYVSFFRIDDAETASVKGSNLGVCLAAMGSFLLELMDEHARSAYMGPQLLDGGKMSPDDLCSHIGCHGDHPGSLKNATAAFIAGLLTDVGSKAEAVAIRDVKIAELEKATATAMLALNPSIAKSTNYVYDQLAVEASSAAKRIQLLEEEVQVRQAKVDELERAAAGALTALLKQSATSGAKPTSLQDAAANAVTTIAGLEVKVEELESAAAAALTALSKQGVTSGAKPSSLQDAAANAVTTVAGLETKLKELEHVAAGALTALTKKGSKGGAKPSSLQDAAANAVTTIAGLEAELVTYKETVPKQIAQISNLERRLELAGETTGQTSAQITALEAQFAQTTEALEHERRLTLQSAEMVGSLMEQLALLQQALSSMKKQQESQERKLKIFDFKSKQEAEGSDPQKVPANYHDLPPPTCDRDVPDSSVTLCFTDVQDSTVQWEAYPDTMAKALRTHNNVIRELIAKHGGYEVKTEGDAFMVAFALPTVAARWALEVQRALAAADWPEELTRPDGIARDAAKIEPEYGFRGLRVRVGIHTGKPQAEPDPVTGRMDYFGQMVNKSARIEGLAGGGQIVASADTFKAISDRTHELLENGERPTCIPMGRFKLKGIPEEAEAFMLLAPEHQKREALPKVAEPAKSQAADEVVASLREANEALKQALAKAREELAQARESVNEFCAKLAADGGDNPALAAALQVAERHTKEMEDEFENDESDDVDGLQQSLQELLMAQAELKAQEKNLSALQRANSSLESDIEEARLRVLTAERARAEAEEAARRQVAYEFEHEASCSKLTRQIKQMLPKIQSLENEGRVIAYALADPTDAYTMAAIKTLMPPGHHGDVTLDQLHDLAQATSARLKVARTELSDLRDNLRHVHTHEHQDADAIEAFDKEQVIDELVRSLIVDTIPVCPTCGVEHHILLPPAVRAAAFRVEHKSKADEPATLDELNALFDVMDPLKRALVRSQARKNQPKGDAQRKAEELLSLIAASLGSIRRSAGDSIYHRKCFVCAHQGCKNSLSDQSYVYFAKGRRENNDNRRESIFCNEHASSAKKSAVTQTESEGALKLPRARLLTADTCAACKTHIAAGQDYVKVPPNDTVFHDGCFVCDICGDDLNEFGMVDGKHACPSCLPNIVAELATCVENIQQFASHLAVFQEKVAGASEFYEAQRAVVESGLLRKALENIAERGYPFPPFNPQVSDSQKAELASDHILRYKSVSQDVIVFAKDCVLVLHDVITQCDNMVQAQKLRQATMDAAAAMVKAADAV